MSHMFREYAPYTGPIPTRTSGALVSTQFGKATSYSLDTLQQRGRMFIGAAADFVVVNPVISVPARFIIIVMFFKRFLCIISLLSFYLTKRACELVIDFDLFAFVCRLLVSKLHHIQQKRFQQFQHDSLETLESSAVFL